MKNEAAKQGLKYFSYDTHQRSNSGSVFVKNLAFLGIWPKESKKFTWWYVCIISCGTEIFGTAASQPNADGDVWFNEEFEIKTHSRCFGITVTLYGIMLPHNNEKVGFILNIYF